MKKKYGQNFLTDKNILNEIVSAACITDDDLIIEIGPGIGSLTQYLAKEAKQVVCIEIDKKLINILDETLKDYENVEVINADILKININDIIEKYNYKNTKVIANLPYYITTPIVTSLLEGYSNLNKIVIMVQKEVANRMVALHNTKDYGSISLFVKYYAKAKIVTKVPAECFIPNPKVESAIVSLDIKLYEKSIEFDENFMFKLIRAGFEQRRKTFVNCIFNSNLINLSKDEIGDFLEEIGFNRNIRGEALSLDDYINITKELKKRQLIT